MFFLTHVTFGMSSTISGHWLVVSMYLKNVVAIFGQKGQLKLRPKTHDWKITGILPLEKHISLGTKNISPGKTNRNHPQKCRISEKHLYSLGENSHAQLPQLNSLDLGICVEDTPSCGTVSFFSMGEESIPRVDDLNKFQHILQRRKHEIWEWKPSKQMFSTAKLSSWWFQPIGSFV